MTKLVSSGAGHGGTKASGSWRDPGALSADKKRTEADITRVINDRIIKATGVADTTDNKGTSVNDNLYRIATNINNAPDGIALSHHLNAFDGKATGVEVLYGSSAEKPLAAKLSAAIAKELGIADRGAKDGSWLSIAANSKANKKVLLIEWCFIDNPNDLAKLDKNMDSAISAILNVFGMKTQTSKSSYLEFTKPIRVQALKDIIVYHNKERTNKSTILYKKGSVFILDEYVTIPNKVPVGKPRAGGFVTINTDYVKAL